MKKFNVLMIVAMILGFSEMNASQNINYDGCAALKKALIESAVKNNGSVKDLALAHKAEIACTDGSRVNKNMFANLINFAIIRHKIFRGWRIW